LKQVIQTNITQLNNNNYVSVLSCTNWKIYTVNKSNQANTHTRLLFSYSSHFYVVNKIKILSKQQKHIQNIANIWLLSLSAVYLRTLTSFQPLTLTNVTLEPQPVLILSSTHSETQPGVQCTQSYRTQNPAMQVRHLYPC